MMIATSHGKRTVSCDGHVRVRDRDDGSFSFQDGRIRRDATRPRQVSRWSLPFFPLTPSPQLASCECAGRHRRAGDLDVGAPATGPGAGAGRIAVGLFADDPVAIAIAIAGDAPLTVEN